jgi:hypothetical protein
MLRKNLLMMFLVGLIIIMEILPLLCDDFFFLFFFFFVLLRYLFHVPLGERACLFFALILQSICNKRKKQENFKQKMGFFIYIFFFSLYMFSISIFCSFIINPFFVHLIKHWFSFPFSFVYMHKLVFIFFFGLLYVL